MPPKSFGIFLYTLEGIRPFVSENDSQSLAPLFAGALHYTSANAHASIGVMSTYVKNTGTAWNHFLDAAIQYFEKILAGGLHVDQPVPAEYRMFNTDFSKVAPVFSQFSGKSGVMAQILGEKTAQLHLILTPEKHHPEFSPEQMSRLYQRSLYQSMRTKARRIITDSQKDSSSTSRRPVSIWKCHSYAGTENPYSFQYFAERGLFLINDSDTRAFW